MLCVFPGLTSQNRVIYWLMLAHSLRNDWKRIVGLVDLDNAIKIQAKPYRFLAESWGYVDRLLVFLLPFQLTLKLH